MHYVYCFQFNLLNYMHFRHNVVLAYNLTRFCNLLKYSKMEISGYFSHKLTIDYLHYMQNSYTTLHSLQKAF